MDKPPNINGFFSRLLIDRLVNEGISYYIISPGSRSTPLAVAASEHPQVKTKVIIDERSAAFYALGYARASGCAPGLICTSGTAVANYFPAIVEAYQSRLPLVVLSADRPQDLQDCGANQTISQRNIYGRFAVCLAFDAPDDTLDPETVLDEIEKVVKKTWVQGSRMSMPLHINCSFREPLAPDEENYNHKQLNSKVAKWYKNRPVDLTGYNLPDYGDDIKWLAEQIKKRKKGIIIAGPETKYRHCAKIGMVSDKLNWPILADVLSQVRFVTQEIAGYPIGMYDSYIDSGDAIKHLKPEMIIHFGGLPTSKRLNQYLLSLKGIPYIKIQNHERTIDPDGIETRRIMAEPNLLVDQLLAQISTAPDKKYLAGWVKTDYQCLTELNRLEADGDLSEFTVPKSLVEILPTKDALFLSNSMPVRDADSFMPVSRKALQVGANRGASGIDGIIASACGFSAACERPVTILIGDLAFLHDIGSLRLVSEAEKPVIIIVINNNGGGIFSFLPIAKHEKVFEEYFGTPQKIDCQAAAQMTGITYDAPETLQQFKDACSMLVKENRSGLIEVTTDRTKNVKLHNTIRETICQVLSNSK
ncbi:MAG: 2-succinyl-5-enolpyruvyl-6-hydroxy-3-cyclohexene-1-carboxylic-acid synthase [candidate division Zixibacteria bacterium]|nr:2-succinyl-5-enolpyruvyl-6-hydroxy-3-cyclohexene-1-carboxylic-acid synthase [candidate division Zixibacteria bacterium]